MSLRPAARLVLRTRLDLVAESLPLAAFRSTEDVEHVHQLRVATRRASAALRIFADLCPHKRFAWFKKNLKRIRQAAGAARDRDVLLQRWRKLAEEMPHPAWRDLLRAVAQQRRAVQKPIAKVAERMARKDLDDRIKDLVSHLKLPDWMGELNSLTAKSRVPFGEFARWQLRAYVEDFFATEPATHDDEPALHAFRIAGKRLRYSLEVFAAAFPKSLKDELYPVVEELQSMLGDVNDHSNARVELAAWLSASPNESRQALLSQLQEREVRSLAQCRDRFFLWWTPARSLDLRTALDDLPRSSLRVPPPET